MSGVMRMVAVALAALAVSALAGNNESFANEQLLGNFPQADIIDCAWLPSRSTHYGLTPSGACGMGNVPNCWPGGGVSSECASLPKSLLNPYIGGLYAAPDGNYYAQVKDYFSCGECFQIQCDDQHCLAGQTITVQIADSCPCKDNPKWCCGYVSDCKEMNVLPSLEGLGHCPALGGAYTTRSIHLDLSDYAFAMLSTGAREGAIVSGVINTRIRRVMCPVQGNIFIKVETSCAQQACSVNNSPQTVTCYYHLEFTTLNAAGRAGIAQVQFLGRTLTQGVLSDAGVFNLTHDPNYVQSAPQTRYAGWTHTNGVALVVPFKLRFVDRLGNVADSVEFNSKNLPLVCSTGLGCFVDSGVQFPAPALPANPSTDCVPSDPVSPTAVPPPPVPKDSSTAPNVPSSSGGATGSAPPSDTCFVSSAVDSGSNPYYLEFNIVPTAGHTIASVVASNGSQTYKLTGPADWGNKGHSIFTAQTGNTGMQTPFQLTIKDSAGAVNHLNIAAFAGTYSCA